MRGISILLALIMGTFSHTGYFNRVADTAERAIRKMSGVVVIGKIILQNAERLGSAVGAEDGMPEGTDGEAAEDPGSDCGEEAAAEEAAENPASPETEDLTAGGREASETPDAASGDRAAPGMTGEDEPEGEAAASETAEAKEPVSEAAGDTEPEQEKTEPEIGIEIIINPDGPDADFAFGNGGNGPLLFEFEDPDAKERKEQLPDC